jgi:hypothetical protein
MSICSFLTWSKLSASCVVEGRVAHRARLSIAVSSVGPCPPGWVPSGASLPRYHRSAPAEQTCPILQHPTFIPGLIEADQPEQLTAAGASTLTQQPSFTMLSLTFPIPAALSSVYP